MRKIRKMQILISMKFCTPKRAKIYCCEIKWGNSKQMPGASESVIYES